MPAFRLPNAISKNLCSHFILFLVRLYRLLETEGNFSDNLEDLIVDLKSAAVVTSFSPVPVLLTQDSAQNSCWEEG